MTILKLLVEFPGKLFYMRINGIDFKGTTFWPCYSMAHSHILVNADLT